MEVVEDDDSGFELDDISYTEFKTEKKQNDPFLEVKISSLSPKMKRKANRLAKKYEGIGGNLFAFACKYSQEIGFDGVVAFFAKTNLIHHYSVTLRASLFKNQKMLIFKKDAEFLINKYFKDEEK
jgi:hypothetical protein